MRASGAGVPATAWELVLVPLHCTAWKGHLHKVETQSCAKQLAIPRAAGSPPSDEEAKGPPSGKPREDVNMCFPNGLPWWVKGRTTATVSPHSSGKCPSNLNGTALPSHLSGFGRTEGAAVPEAGPTRSPGDPAGPCRPSQPCTKAAPQRARSLNRPVTRDRMTPPPGENPGLQSL